MTGSEQREAARQFINRWRGKGKEDEDGRSYWIELLSNVFGVENVTERIDFEKKVVVDGNTKRIDVYIPETRVIIEQKSLNVPLNKKIRNSGDIDLTPFEQADIVLKEGLAAARPFFFFYWIMHSIICFAIKSSS